MPAEPRCMNVGCEEQGIWQPIYIIRPLGDPPSSTRVIKAEVGMVVCSDHKAALTIDDFIGGEGWVQITNAIRAAKRMSPDPDVILDWREIERCNYDDKVTGKCDEYIVEHIILTYNATPESKQTHVQLKGCSRHIVEVKRLLMEGEIHPDLVQYLPLEGTVKGYDVTLPESN